MARDLNKIMVIGRVGTDPEMRYTASGKAVTNFRMAVSRRSRPSDTGGEPRDETDWFTVDAWDKLAEITNQYLTKGARIYIEGRLHTRSWEDQSGQKRNSFSIVASEMIMLDSRRSSERPEGGDSPGMEDHDVDDIPF